VKTSAIEANDLASGPAVQPEAASSGVSWGAVIGGAFVTAALSLILLALGAGFGLSTMSPWPREGAPAAAIGAAAIIWLIVTQLIASAMGGYLTGRWRVKWTSIHGDEVHFRDTANGFLAWAVALVMTVAFLTTAAAAMAGGVAVATERRDTNAYVVDRLFPSDRPAASDGDSAVRAQASRALEHSLLRPDAAQNDSSYLAQLVAAKAGVSPDEAGRRVSGALAEARQNADEARKATARVLLWLFLALLMGAFCASYAATVGGRQRDRVQHI
jgi:hypothetical protein